MSSFLKSKSEFGVKDYHETSIINFMRFSRSQRALSIRTIQAAYKDIEYARLKNETTLTVDEVHDILAELWDSAKEEIDTELSHQSHTYVLLLRQLFLQAEHWHLKLQADISELENKLVWVFIDENHFKYLSYFDCNFLKIENCSTGYVTLRMNSSLIKSQIIKRHG